MTQVIPRDDDFSVGPGARGSTLSLWVRMRPWTSMPDYSSSGCEYADLEFWSDEIRMTDGFSKDLAPDLTSVTLSRGAVVTGRELLRGRAAAFCEVDSVNAWPRLGGAFFRNAVAEDLDVEALFGFVSNTDLLTSGNDFVRYIGLAARLQGGTVADDGDQDRETVEDQDGYFFVRAQKANAPPNGGKYLLLRSVGGVVTRLADYPSGEDNVLAPTTFQSGEPMLLRLKVETVSGDVELTAWAGRITDSDTPVLSYTDSSGSKITGDGRAGIFASVEWYSAIGPSGAAACSWVQAKDVDAGTLLFREEWLRNVGLNRQDVPNVGKTALVPVSDYEGDSLLGAFYHDLGGSSDTFVSTVPEGQPWGQLVYNPGGDGVLIEWDNLRQPLGGQLWCPSHFKAESAKTSRFATFEFKSGGSAGASDRAFSLLVREGGTLDLPGEQYEARIEIDDIGATTDATCSFRSWLFSSPTPDWCTATVTITEGATHKIEVQTENIDNGPGQVQDAVRLKVFVDDVQVVFTGTPPVGVTLLADGTLIDERSFRLSNNRGEGFGAFIPDASPEGIIVHTWGRGVFDEPEVPQADIPEFTVSREGDSPVGTLVIPAGWSVTQIPESAPQVRVHEFEAGYFRTEGKASKFRPRWELQGRCTKEELDDLLTFRDEHNGGEIAFSWTDQRGGSHVAHFIGGFSYAPIAPNAFRFSCGIEALNE